MINHRQALAEEMSIPSLPDLLGPENQVIGANEDLDELLMAWANGNRERLCVFVRLESEGRLKACLGGDDDDGEAECCGGLSEDDEYTSRARKYRGTYSKKRSASGQSGRSAQVNPPVSKDSDQAALDAIDFDFSGLSPSSPIPCNIMDLVLTRQASREQLWVLEGALVRLMLVSDDAVARHQYVLLWMAVFLAKTGSSVPRSFHFHVRKVEDARYGVLTCEEQTTLEELYERRMDTAQAEIREWTDLFRAMFKLRRRWAFPADLMSCGVHPPYSCPFDVDFDRDWSRHSTGMFCMPGAERRTDVVARVSATPVFHRGIFDPFEGNCTRGKKSRYM